MGGILPLVWPSTEDMRAVEAALVHRPPTARNWNPDETIGYLLAENVEHGGFDPETGSVVGDIGADQSRAPAVAALMVAGRELGAQVAWVTPRVWTVGELATAAKLNEISSALNDLDRRTSPTTATVNTVESTTATSFSDLATAGPAVTVTIGSTGKAVVALYCALSNASGNFAIASYAVSGATTVAAAEQWSLQTNNTSDLRAGFTVLHTGLTPGSNTFTMKYRVTSGTGGFNGRRILVTPMGS